jgi:hypothetical protein
VPAVGEVWKHLDFYTNGETGELLPKYLLILAIRPDGDIVHRLLTSRPYNRVEDPACSHDEDRPGYFLGVLQPAGELGKKTWLDLRELSEDYDKREFDQCIKNTILTRVHTIPVDILCPALGCAAYAPDTTRKQKDYIMNARAVLGCA